MAKINKNTYLQGAFIATFGIVLSKILGIIYVIPFYSIIGEAGGALYGYAYNIYSIFLSISTAGVSLAISSITSEYNTLGMYGYKEKSFKIAKHFLNIIGLICFIVLFIFAKDIAYLIIGDISGGNSIEDITFVIRVISFSILIVPILSVYRGYLQGHKYIVPTSVSQVLEQFVRVMIIIFGSYLAIKVFGLKLKYAVALALFGATAGAICSYLYLRRVVRNNKDELSIDYDEKEAIDQILIIKKIMACAFPFIICDLFKSLYNSVDTLFVVKTLVHLGYDVIDAESIMSVISTWGNKLNMIVVAVGTGFVTSLIPNLTASIVKKDKKDVDMKINQTLSALIYITLPMVIGLSFLHLPVWNAFYGMSKYGSQVFMISIFVAFFNVILSSTMIFALSLKEIKTLLTSLVLGLAFNAIFDVPLMYLLNNFNCAHYGAILSTILGYTITIIIILSSISHKYKISFKPTLKNALMSVVSVLLMVIILMLLTIIIPLNVKSRMLSFIIVLIYAILGGAFYLFITYKSKIINSVFGNDICNKLYKKLKRKI